MGNCEQMELVKFSMTCWQDYFVFIKKKKKSQRKYCGVKEEHTVF